MSDIDDLQRSSAPQPYNPNHNLKQNHQLQSPEKRLSHTQPISALKEASPDRPESLDRQDSGLGRNDPMNGPYQRSAQTMMTHIDKGLPSKINSHAPSTLQTQ